MHCPSCRGEFREGFTWCQDCETSLVPLLLAKPAQVERLRAWREPPEDEEQEEPEEGEVTGGAEPDPVRSLRAVELLLVLFVAFASPLLSALHIWWNGTPPKNYGLASYSGFARIVSSTSAIAVLCYVLFRQGRNLRQLGLTAEKSDIAPTLLLTVLGFVPSFLAGELFGHPVFVDVEAYPLRILSGIANLNLIGVISLLLSAALEELIVRAYLITEVMELTGQALLAVLSSACLQALYHLYQGSYSALVAAASFLIASIYYLKYRRITPVILSHFLYNLLLYSLWAAP
jgi:membrane protease YdiL (CAAX protease family)